jgi:hypothetical protein
MKIRHAITGLAAVSAHAVVGFTHDALYAATGDLVVEPKLIHWLASYGGYCLAGIALAMLGLQLYVDWPVIKSQESKL